MKTSYSKLHALLICSILSLNAFSQGNWRIGGNNSFPPNPINNINNWIGTQNNLDFRMATVNETRMMVNGARNNTINLHNMDRSGFVSIGNNIGNFFTDFNKGAYSMLHLNGAGNPPALGLDVLGHHDWMHTGITFTGNHDLAYLGLRSVGNVPNVTEFVALWSNNATTFGPDDMAFRFSSNNGSQTVSPDYNSIIDGDGLHVMRLTGTGRMGLGPTFGVGNAIYATPQSLQHLSYNNNEDVFTQYTNRLNSGGGGTAETTNDGFRVGIMGSQNNLQNGNAYLIQQEQRHILFATDISLTNMDPLNTRDRMRITSISAPTELAAGYGVYNPANLPTSRTRVSISHEPNNPVTRPLSLLHLGYNTGLVGIGTTDGWRNWMDIGTFTSNGTDNMYIGLKQEAGAFPLNDKHDAVINWGDNGGSNPLNGPDNLRFIFTETTTGQGNPPANTNNGLEVARFDPQKATTIAVASPNFGMMGIGDWTTAFNTANPIDSKLDIDGDLRIRQVTQVDNLERVLVIDENDLNRVHWRDLSSFGWGNLCSSPTVPLAGDYEIDMDNNDIFFHNRGSINIGNVVCGGPELARIFVRNTLGTSGADVGIWSECAGQLDQTAGRFRASQYGVYTTLGTGGYTGISSALYAAGGLTNSGPTINAWAGYFVGDVSHTGGYYNPSETMLKENIDTIKTALDNIRLLNTITFNYKTSSFPSMNLPGDLEYGVIAEDVESIFPDLVKNIIQPEVLDSSGNVEHPAVNYKGVNYIELIPIALAGIKELDEIINQVKDTIINTDSIDDGRINDFENRTLSDSTLKNNVTPLINSLALLKQLNGINFKWDTLNYPWKNLETDNQIGYIAQDVNAIVPEVVFQDDSGYYHVDYQKLMPMVTEGMKQLDSVNQALETRITAIEDCINSANICASQLRLNEEDDNNEGQVVELENLNAIILDQNLPNPFKEKTTINYSIPEEVIEAQLLFYDMNGRIIKQVDINERGDGKMTVYGENLKNGIYTYSLIADGELISTKRMVKSK